MSDDEETIYEVTEEGARALIAMLNEQAKEGQGRPDDERIRDPILEEFGLNANAMIEAVTVDVMDTFKEVLSTDKHPDHVKGTAQGVQAVSTEFFAGLLATHSQLWFTLGLRWAREHG